MAGLAINNLPDGYVLDVPVDAPSTGLPDGYILDSNISTAPPSFADRISTDLSNRGDKTLNAIGQVAALQKPAANLAVELPAQAIGAGFDVAGEAAKSIEPLLPISQLINALPNSVKQPFQQAGQAVGQVVGQSANYIGNQFSGVNPNLKDLASAGATFAGAAPAREVAGEGLSGVGQALVQSGENNAASKLTNAVTKAVIPDLTVKQAIKAGVPERIQQDVFGSTILPSMQEKAAIEQVVQLPGFKPSNTNVKNYQLVSNALENEAAGLRDTLKSSNVTFKPEDYQLGLTDLKTQIQNTKGISDAARAARIAPIDTMIEITNGLSTPADLLSARQELDKTFFSDKGVLPASAKKIYKDAISPVRDYTNNFIGNIVPDAAVKNSLAKQSALFTARDNLASKAIKERPSAAGRVMQKIDDMMPGGTPLAKRAASVTALGALGAGVGTGVALAPMAAGAATIVGLPAYGIYKALTSPSLRKTLGYALDKTGQLLQNGERLTPAKVASMPPAKQKLAMSFLKQMESMTPEQQKILIEKNTSK